MKLTKSVFLLLATFALGLSACGSSQASSSSPTSSAEPASSSEEPTSSGESSSSSEEQRYYTIKWVNYNDELLEKDEKVPEGTVPTYDGDDPTHPSEEHYTYVWAGWDSKVVAARKNETYKAVFNKVGEKYDITWKNYDGSELLVTKDEYGKLPEYTGAVPTKPSADPAKVNVFKGWSPEVVAVVGETTYTAVFEEKEKGESLSVKLSLPANAMWGLEDNPDLEYEFDYKDSFFFGNNEQRDDELALTSLVMSGFNDSKENMKKYLDAVHFTDIVYSPTYETDGFHEIDYILAKKVIDDTTVIAVSIRGFNYGTQMVGNFFMGQSGEHIDFKQAMSYVYLGLIEYIAKQITTVTKVKLWINGYSRAAAVANLLGKQLYEKALRNELGGITKDDIYTYCFETPLCGDSANNGAYPFIHNYTNSRDFITYVPPREYGFKVYGEVVDIYDENIADLLKNFNEKLVLAAFQPYKLGINFTELKPEILPEEESPKDIKEYLDLLFEVSLAEDTSGRYSDLSTRANYYNFIETHLEYLANFGINLSKETEKIDALIEAVQGDTSLLLSLLASLGAETPDDFVNLIEDLLDRCEIDYSENDLRLALVDLRGILAFHLMQFISSMNSLNLVNGIVTMVKNVNPAVMMHLLEPSYVLLKNLINKQNA